MEARLGTHWDDVYVSPYRTEMATMHRVRLGPFDRRGDAIARADQLQRRGVRSLVVEEVVR
jgi:hypothetical protein